MARAKPVLNAVDYKNSIGQTIKPGDDVIIVTTCTSRVNIKPGIYLGKKNDGVSCRVLEHHTHYRFKETGEDVKWNWYGHAKERGLLPEYPKYVPYAGTPAPRYGDPEYQQKYAAYKEEYDAWSKQRQADNAEYSRKNQEAFAQYESFKVPYNRHTTLQLNRIYKMDTSVFDLNV